MNVVARLAAAGAAAASLYAASGPAAAQWYSVPAGQSAYVPAGTVTCPTFTAMAQYREFRLADVRLMPAGCVALGQDARIVAVKDVSQANSIGFAVVRFEQSVAGMSDRGWDTPFGFVLNDDARRGR